MYRPLYQTFRRLGRGRWQSMRRARKVVRAYRESCVVGDHFRLRQWGGRCWHELLDHEIAKLDTEMKARSLPVWTPNEEGQDHEPGNTRPRQRQRGRHEL